MEETLLQKAQRLGIKPIGTAPTTSQPTTTNPLLQKAQSLGIQPINKPEPTKSFAQKTGDFLFPNVKEFSNMVSSATVMKDPAYEGLLKSQEQTLNTENNLRSRLMTETDPIKKKGLQDILTSTVNQKLANQAEIDKISKPQMKTGLQKAGTALGVGLDLGLTADLPLLGANLLRKPLMNVAPKLTTSIAETFGKKVGPDLTKEVIKRAPTALQPALTKTSQFLAPKAVTEADRLAFKAKSFLGKTKEIGMDALKMMPESAGVGYGYDVSQGLQEGEGSKAFQPGLMTAVGALLPVGIGGMRVAVQPLSALKKTLRSLGTPTEEMIKIEQSKLKNAYESAFKMRESTDAKNTFLKSQGKEPSEVLAKYGLIPDTEYTNGKTVMRTKNEGGAVDEVSDLIGNRGEQIQSTLDNVERANPSGRMSVDEVERQALADAQRTQAGVDLIPIQNQIKTRTAGLRAKYGDTIGPGQMNIERVATNRGTKAWLKPQFELDADAVLGGTFRKYIDNIIDDKIVRQVNAEIGDLIAARKMLMAIDGKNIGGGRFTNIMASMAGSIIGAMASPSKGIIGQVITSLASALGVKIMLRMLQRGEFGGATTKRILQYLAEDKMLLNQLISKEPKLIQEAFLREIKASMKTPLLPAGKAGANSADIFTPMEMRGATTYEPKAQQIAPTRTFNPRDKKYYEKGVMGGQRSIASKTTKQIINDTKNAIPAIIPPAKKKATPLQPKKKDKIVNPKDYKTAEEFVKAQGDSFYHTTPANFEKFDKKFLGSNTNFDNTRIGFYFTDSPEQIADFKNVLEKGFGGTFTTDAIKKTPAELAQYRTIEKITKKENFFNFNYNAKDLTSKEARDFAEFADKKMGGLYSFDGDIVNHKKMTDSQLNKFLKENVFVDDLDPDSSFLPQFTEQYLEDFTKFLEKKGYKGMISDYAKGQNEYLIFDPNILPTKSQLVDTWNKAQSKPLTPKKPNLKTQTAEEVQKMFDNKYKGYMFNDIEKGVYSSEEIVPLNKVKPSQSGEDLYNETSRAYAKGETSFYTGPKTKFGPTGEKSIHLGKLESVEQLPPIIVDENYKIIDGNHRWAALEMNGIKEVKVIIKLSENKPLTPKGIPNKQGGFATKDVIKAGAITAGIAGVGTGIYKALQPKKKEVFVEPKKEEPINKAIIGGVDITDWATDVGHEGKVYSIFNSEKIQNMATPDQIDTYMKENVGKYKPGAKVPITGNDISDAADKYGIDPRILIAIFQADSHFGVDPLAQKTKNPGNVRNYPKKNGTMHTQGFKTWRDGVFGAAKELADFKVE
jgi:hypothetical protein